MSAVEQDLERGPTTILTHLSRELVSRSRTRLPALVDSVVGRYRHEFAPHGQISHHVQSEALRGLAKTTVDAFLEAVAHGTPLGERHLSEPTADLLVVSGLPESAILAAYEAAAAAVWRHLSDEVPRMRLESELSAQILSAVGSAVFDAFARLSGALRHRSSMNGNGSSRSELQRDVFNALLVSPHLGERTLRDAAERVGYRLGEAHVVALVALCGPGESRKWAGPLGPITEVAATLGRLRLGGMDPVAAPRDTEAVAIYPVMLDRVPRRLSERLWSVIGNGALPAGVEPVVAIGGVQEGVVGIATSYDQARRTLVASQATLHNPRAVSYMDLVPTLLLLENRHLAVDLRRSTLEPLERHDAEQGSELVNTLRAVTEERGNTSAAAKRLHIHRHTLIARQQRIEDLTGLSFRRSRDLMLLELGLRTLELPRDEPVEA